MLAGGFQRDDRTLILPFWAMQPRMSAMKGVADAGVSSRGGDTRGLGG